MRAITDRGMSSPRASVVGRSTELSDLNVNHTLDAALPVALNLVVNGRIEKRSDIDCYRFLLRRGERVVVESWADLIDSRGVPKLYDAQGKRLATNRGHARLDPRLVFVTPSDGDYTVRIFDLSFWAVLLVLSARHVREADRARTVEVAHALERAETVIERAILPRKNHYVLGVRKGTAGHRIERRNSGDGFEQRNVPAPSSGEQHGLFM